MNVQLFLKKQNFKTMNSGLGSRCGHNQKKKINPSCENVPKNQESSLKLIRKKEQHGYY